VLILGQIDLKEAQMDIAKKIKEKRKSLCLTQKEFSNALDLGCHGDRTIRRWENGETNPSALELKAILNFNKTTPFMKKNDDPKYSFIDLFAGIGGMRIPFQNNNCNCVFSSEWDKFSQKTYAFNFGEKPKGDITKIPSKNIPDFDILLAGFPCQPFSQAGLGKGFDDTRGTLFFEIERIIRDKRPKAFLLENVKRLNTHDKGRTIKIIQNHLEKLNYTFDSEVLRAADFGLPQNRERIYIVGFDKERFKIESDFHFKYPKPKNIKTRLGNILSKNVDPKYTISDKLYAGHIRRKKEHQKKGNGFGFTLYDMDAEYTNTLSARYYKDGSEILISQGDKKNPRKLTPRECAKLQGFPDDFIIPVSDTQAYKQFGNSVAIPVIESISKKIIEQLDNLNTRSNNISHTKCDII
jgi:DNA (cytosine-5)-methyltransferase 1